MTPNICKCGCLRPCGGNSYFSRHDTWNVTRTSPVDYIVESRGYKTPCWIWQLGISKYGYGKIKVAGHTFGAHRYYYEQFVDVIPAHLVIDHLCRVHACVNPSHLEVVTNAVNVRRGIGTKLDQVSIQEVLSLHLAGNTLTAIAMRLGLSVPHVHDIVHGIRWSDVVGASKETKNLKRVLSDEEIRELRKLHIEGASIPELAVQYGVSYPTAYRIATHRTWKGVV